MGEEEFKIEGREKSLTEKEIRERKVSKSFREGRRGRE